MSLVRPVWLVGIPVPPGTPTPAAPTVWQVVHAGGLAAKAASWIALGALGGVAAAVVVAAGVVAAGVVVLGVVAAGVVVFGVVVVAELGLHATSSDTATINPTTSDHEVSFLFAMLLSPLSIR
jgi:hypothetical protein